MPSKKIPLKKREVLKFEPGKYYRHKNFGDVDLFILQLNNISMVVLWVSQKDHNFVYGGRQDLILIPNDLPRWSEVQPK